jgi:UDP-hydrolysing UDP-N-acetyl-D-glucosamine 2-epimerase
VSPRLAVVTGTRAEYGIFRPLLRALRARGLAAELYVTGTHLATQFGSTVEEIEADGQEIAERVDIMVAGDTPGAVTKSIGLAIISFGELLSRRRPDLLLILGDRFEAMAVAIAAQVAGIPVGHLHGGEVTEGVIDEAFRHAITKMSALHLTATEVYRERVIQLGEDPAAVHNVGALGLDNIAQVPPVDRATLEAETGFSFRQHNIIVTQHPLTLDLDRSAADTRELLAAMADLIRQRDLGILITGSNADPGGAAITTMMREFAAAHPQAATFVTSLGTRRYFNALRHVDAVVGNSSSGLIEVPSFGIATVNIGDRQAGRVTGDSVFNVPAARKDIVAAVETALAPETRARLAGLPNPYGDGHTAERICRILANLRFPLAVQKRFHDLPTR